MKRSNSAKRSIIWRLLPIGIGLVIIWQCIVWWTQVPPFILPPPVLVVQSLISNFSMLLGHASVTLIEIVLGLLIGTGVGLFSALLMVRFRSLHDWMLPVLIISQAIPVFALAPILVLWIGYGMASKVAMCVIITYFPVTASCYDGLRQTDSGWMDLARTLGATQWTRLRYIQLPAALPSIASGLRIAASVAPIGAIVGEWVGSSAGLGYLMLHANGRMQIDLMFAALLILAIIALVVYFTIDMTFRHLLHWLPDHRVDPAR